LRITAIIGDMVDDDIIFYEVRDS